MWLIGKKFEKTVGVSFNTINHLCWNILHNPSLSCPCCYFPSLIWYKMYILFVVLESHFSHAGVEGLRVQPITAPFGVGGATGFLPSSGALNLPVRTWLLLPSGLHGGDADSSSALSSAPRLRPRGHNAMKIRSQNEKVQDDTCVRSQDMASASISFAYLVFPQAR